jgi:hypothetical protein
MSQEGMLAPTAAVPLTEAESLSETAEKEIRERLAASRCVLLRDSEMRAYAVVMVPSVFDLLNAAAEFPQHIDADAYEDEGISLEELQKFLKEE